VSAASRFATMPHRIPPKVQVLNTNGVMEGMALVAPPALSLSLINHGIVCTASSESFLFLVLVSDKLDGNGLSAAA